MNTTLTFIDNPKYVVDFSVYEKKEEQATLSQKIQQSATLPFVLVKAFFSSLAESSYVTLSYSGVSFKHIVLGYYGSMKFLPPEDIHLAIFKIAFWALGMGWCLTTTTIRLFLQKCSLGSPSLLHGFADSEINVDHIQCKDYAIDTRKVPDTVKVDDLMGIFDSINDPKKFENHSTDALRTDLQTFVRRVTNREPFLGTPPSYDAPRLMAFYQQIEDAVRFSIHKVNKDLEEFKKTHGENSQTYTEETKKQYENLLEDKERVALDLAIAGKYCGARYMGEAMSVYYLQKKSATDDENLQNTLIEILAHKRKEIAHGQIETHLGTDTHAFTNYMGKLGGILGISGTKNVIEHLSKSLDQNHYLRLFFQEYTVNCIIEAVQDEMKKSQKLREKILDWIADQVGDWNKEEYTQKKNMILEQVHPILEQEFAKPSLDTDTNNFELFLDLIESLTKNDIELPKKPEESEKMEWSFVDELFALDVAKEWAKKKFGDNLLQRRTKTNAIKTTLSEERIGRTLAESIHQAIVKGDPLEQFREQFPKIEKAHQIKKTLNEYEMNVSIEALLRVVKREVTLESFIEDGLKFPRRTDFLTKLSLETMKDKGVSKKIIEWLLVSQGILLPQKNQEKSNQKREPHPNYTNKIIQIFCHSLENSDVEKEAIQAWIQQDLLNYNVNQNDAKQTLQNLQLKNVLTNHLRYRPGVSSVQDQLLHCIFEQAFAHDRDGVIKAAEAEEKKSFYPLWKKVCWIKAPHTCAAVTGNPLVKIAISIAAFYGSYKAGEAAYTRIAHFTVANKGVPFFINHTPSQIIRMGNCVASAGEWVLARKWSIVTYGCLTKWFISRMPKIPYITQTANKITFLNIINILFVMPQSTLSFLVNNSITFAFFIWNQNEICRLFFENIAGKGEANRSRICKPQAMGLWNQSISSSE